MSEPDFSTYTTTELFEALEGIDDHTFPNRANEIIKLIMQRTQTTEDDLMSAYNGNSATVLFDVLSLLSGMGADQSMLDKTVVEKIRRNIARPVSGSEGNAG